MGVDTDNVLINDCSGTIKEDHANSKWWWKSLWVELTYKVTNKNLFDLLELRINNIFGPKVYWFCMWLIMCIRKDVKVESVKFF